MISSENAYLHSGIEMDSGGGGVLLILKMCVFVCREALPGRSHRSDRSYFAAPAGGDVSPLSLRAAASVR